MKLHEFVSKLEFCKETKAKYGMQQSWIARCPAHDDKTPSLSINLTNDGIPLMKCHTGCHADDVIAAVGMEWEDILPDNIQNRKGILARIKKGFDVDELHVAIAKDRRRQGLKQTAQEKREELEAFMRLRARQD